MPAIHRPDDHATRTGEPAVLALPSRLDLSTVAATADRLRAASGRALRIDAASVEQLGALGAQLLIAAALSARAAGASLRVAPRSDAFDAHLAALGLTLGQIESDPDEPESDEAEPMTEAAG